MNKDDIKITDLYRFLNGEIPLEFYVELTIRTLFVYLVITFGLRYMGKRISSQLSRSELAALSTLAAATGLVILAPDRGLIPPLIVIGVIIGIKRWIQKRNIRSEKFEFLTEGHLTTLVYDGVLQLKPMQDARISKEQLFAQLRGQEIIHLGMVKRVYHEANGSFTVIKAANALPGLPVIPEWDRDFLNEQKRSTEATVCTHCGKKREPREEHCANCRNEKWEPGLV
jgi:uncharacterized membrane protein YcaP (DUF421 family)